MSSNAVRYGSRLRAIASWVRVLAFGAVARRESYSIGSGELPTENGRSKQVNLLIVPVKDRAYLNAPALGCNGYIMFLERNRYLLSKLTLLGVPSPVVTRFGVPLHQSTCLGELYIFGFFMKK